MTLTIDAPPDLQPVTTSSALAVEAHPGLRPHGEPQRVDDLAEEPMDYTPVPGFELSAPSFPEEDWAPDPGSPAGF